MSATTRRVVTGVDDDGTSHVVEDGPAPVEGGNVSLWETDGPLQQPLPDGPLADSIGTRHAWHNFGDRPVHMMSVMLSARAPG